MLSKVLIIKFSNLWKLNKNPMNKVRNCKIRCLMLGNWNLMFLRIIRNRLLSPPGPRFPILWISPRLNRLLRVFKFPKIRLIPKVKFQILFNFMKVSLIRISRNSIFHKQSNLWRNNSNSNNQIRYLVMTLS